VKPRRRDFEVRLRRPLATARGTIEGLGIAWWEHRDGDRLLGVGEGAAHGAAAADLDREARERGVPLCSLLAPGAAPRPLPINGLWFDGDPEPPAPPVCKLKSCGDPHADAVRLIAVARAYPAKRWRLDANGSWDRDGAAAFFARIVGVDLDYVEQPLPAEDLDGHAHLHDAGLPIALDESCRDREDWATLAGCCRALVCKPTLDGEPRTLLARIRAARAAGLRVVVTSCLGTGVERAHAAHLALAAGLGDEHHGLAGDHLADDPFPVAQRGGHLLPAGPGIGPSR